MSNLEELEVLANAYIGMDEYPIQATKMYCGINGVARKVKKAYIGVNGVARQFWGEVEPATLAPKQTWYRGTTAKADIEEVEILEAYEPTEDIVETWAADTYETGAIKCYVCKDKRIDETTQEEVEVTVLRITSNKPRIRCNKDSSRLFYGFTKLVIITGLELLNTENVTDMGYMFYNCAALEELDLSLLDASKVTDMQSMFYQCKALGKINFKTEEEVSEAGIIKHPFITSNVTNMSYMFTKCESLIDVDFTKLETNNVEKMRGMFSNISTEIELNISEWNTSKVTDMSYMFTGSSFRGLDASTWDVSNVTNMNYMFNQMKNVKSLDISNWKTRKVTNMSYMFNGLPESIENLKLPCFIIDNVTDMSHMFQNCYLPSIKVESKCENQKNGLINAVSMFECTRGVPNWHHDLTKYKLKQVDLSGFDSTYINNMGDMFKCCAGLTSINLTNFNTSNVTDMSSMFAECIALTSLDLSSFDTSKVTDMYKMFGCVYMRMGLTNLNLTSFNTSNVTDMTMMFEGCASITTLDLTSFETSNVETMTWMFQDCGNMEVMVNKTKWIISESTKTSGMFNNSGATLVYV